MTVRLKRIICFWLILLFLFKTDTKAYAQSLLNPITGNLKITAGPVYRNTNFHWSIAGTPEGTDPDIYSELKYKNIKTGGFNTGAEYRIIKGLAIRLHYTRQYTFSGNATDIDYAGDNRTDYIPPTVGDTLFKSDKGSMRDFNIALSYYFLDKERLKLNAGAGYNSTRELFYLLDDEMPELRTTYRTDWKGLLLFFESVVQPVEKVRIGLEMAYQPVKYRSVANWNLQEAFEHPVSFTHSARGTAWDFSFYGAYRICKKLSAAIRWQKADWRTGYGVDKLYLTTGEVPETRMNGAFRKNSGWLLNMEYAF
ncbi:MAG: hypothetical protein QM640_15780 [Niabella sp.]